MSQERSAGSQIPLFDDLSPWQPEASQLPLAFGPALVEKSKMAVRAPAPRQERREVGLGSIVGQVNRSAFERRKRLLRAATYLNPPTVQSVKEWFNLYSPDKSDEVLDHFLDIYLKSAEAGLLSQFYEKIRKGLVVQKENDTIVSA